MIPDGAARRTFWVAVALSGCGGRPPPSAPPAEVVRPIPSVVASGAESDPPLDEDDAPPPPPASGTVTIKLVADGRRQAHVFWGRKDLGVAPLEISRPRASGPLDLLVVAPGALPLHTRAFTDRSETLALRLYGEKEATGLLGWTPPEPAKIMTKIAGQAGGQAGKQVGGSDKKPRR